MVISKVWILKKHFDGKPELSDFELVEEELPEKLDKGDILCKATHLTVDPYMRIKELIDVEPGTCMCGEAISEVIASEEVDFPVGTVIRSYSGWRSHSLIKNANKQARDSMTTINRIREMDGLPNSLALGAMGMPGMTAYFGFLEVCEPKEGETVLVNAAAGAVGSLVGQIARIKGCKVIGFAGCDEKCKWIKEDLGFNHVFNYKKIDVEEAFKQAAPEGVDCFFDNVGGDFTSTVLQHMTLFGRVSICGQISAYNATKPLMRPYPFSTILRRQLKVQGFDVSRWLPRWSEGEKAMARWIKEGKIKYRESVTNGFENMPKAFIGLFNGENTGKAIIKT